MLTTGSVTSLVTLTGSWAFCYLATLLPDDSPPLWIPNWNPTEIEWNWMKRRKRRRNWAVACAMDRKTTTVRGSWTTWSGCASTTRNHTLRPPRPLPSPAPTITLNHHALITHRRRPQRHPRRRRRHRRRLLLKSKPTMSRSDACPHHRPPITWWWRHRRPPSRHRYRRHRRCSKSWRRCSSFSLFLAFAFFGWTFDLARVTSHVVSWFFLLLLFGSVFVDQWHCGWEECGLQASEMRMWRKAEAPDEWQDVIQ